MVGSAAPRCFCSHCRKETASDGLGPEHLRTEPPWQNTNLPQVVAVTLDPEIRVVVPSSPVR